MRKGKEKEERKTKTGRREREEGRTSRSLHPSGHVRSGALHSRRGCDRRRRRQGLDRLHLAAAAEGHGRRGRRGGGGPLQRLALHLHRLLALHLTLHLALALLSLHGLNVLADAYGVCIGAATTHTNVHPDAYAQCHADRRGQWEQGTNNRRQRRRIQSAVAKWTIGMRTLVSSAPTGFVCTDIDGVLVEHLHRAPLGRRLFERLGG